VRLSPSPIAGADGAIARQYLRKRDVAVIGPQLNEFSGAYL
jgi:hypothetical protein